MCPVTWRVSAKSDTSGGTISRLAHFRKQRQISVVDLARSVGVSRQTIYAIEDGTYVPNTSVALRLGRALGVSVEDLFALDDRPAGTLEADLLNPGSEPLRKGQPVRLCRVEDRLIAVPSVAVPAYLPQSDALIANGGPSSISVLPSSDTAPERLLLAGCDPALSLLGDALLPSRIEIISVPVASQRALDWLQRRQIHAAGSHLLDSRTGAYNVPYIRRHFEAGSVRVITFAGWQQGLLLKAGNPKHLSGIEDLTRRNVTIVNREEGSGSRKLLDAALHRLGIPSDSIRGYDRTASGHLDVARRIMEGEADAGIATESAARCFGLEFIALANERFDLTFTQASLGLPAAQAFLNTLASAPFRAKLREVAGYDTGETGKTQL